MENKITQKHIPDGWRLVRVKDVAFVNKKSLGGEIPSDFEFKYIDLSSVDNGSINLPMHKISLSHAPSRARRVIQKGDVLISTVRPNLKGHCLINFDTSEFICSTGFAVVESKNDLLNSTLSDSNNSNEA